VAPLARGGAAADPAAPGALVAAHTQMQTLHLAVHIEEHAPREADPHYRLFEQAKARLKRQGLWACVVGDELCAGGPELHHSVVEFSQITAADPDKVGRMLGLHFADDADFQRWVESAANLEVLCVNHHRSHYGVHLLPEPLWLAVRTKRAGAAAPAEFIAASALGAGGARAQPPAGPAVRATGAADAEPGNPAS